MGGIFIEVMPFVFPIFMLPSVMFLIEYPKLYETQDLMYSVSLKQFNKTVRIFIMLTLILLYMPIVIRSNVAYFNFSHSFLVATTGSLLLLSIAFYFINAKQNYFEGLFLCLWYLGILNKVPYFDIFFGVNATNKYNQVIFNVLLLFFVMTINFLHPLMMKRLRKVSL